MAAIDKCYVDNFKDYTDFKEWVEDKSFTTPRGVKVNIKNYVYDYWEEHDFDCNPVRPIFNTPTCVDNYLFRNCPLPFIQEWLEDRYCDSEEIIKELKIPNYEPCTKIKIIKKGFWRKNRKFYNHSIHKKIQPSWFVKIENENNTLFYNEDVDFWLLPEENDIWTSSYYCYKGNIKSIIRKILKKWKLPKGCKVTISGRYVNDEWILITK